MAGMNDDPRVYAAADVVSPRWYEQPNEVRQHLVDVVSRALAAADASDAERGLVRVPYDPSMEMLAAGAQEAFDRRGSIHRQGSFSGGIWRAMCDAAAGAAPQLGDSRCETEDR